MRKDYEKLFSRLETPPAPAGLFEKVMLAIRKEEKLAILKYRLFAFSFGLLGSIAVFIPAFRAFKAGLAESGFLEFLSLLSSDTQTVLNYWQSFSLSLLEALPVISLAILLASALTFLESLKMLAKNMKPLVFHQTLTF